MMIISVLYYWIWFYALRLILKDTAWAFIAIFLGLRLHFFNIETSHLFLPIPRSPLCGSFLTVCFFYF